MSDNSFNLNNKELYNSIFKEQEKIKIFLKKASFNKIVTIVKFDAPQDQQMLKTLARELKTKLACGGTYESDQIILQGNHVDEAKKILVEKGYSPDAIEINKLL
jgi:translation initiation factor 1